MRYRFLASFLAAALLCLLSAPAQARFIEYKERHLGPTGLYGVTSPKDIKITKVVEGSPADGKVSVGDVIVAVGGTKIDKHVRQQFAAAIDAAQSSNGNGKLTLTLKGGKTIDLQMNVLGDTADTAPFNCIKTDAVITQAADAMIASGKYGRFEIGLLGLLATGEPKYIEVVKQRLHAAEWASPKLKLSVEKFGRYAWGWGYQGIILSEYYLLTGDEYVLPAIEQYAVNLAKGRDAAGLWGHGIAALDRNEGVANGRLPGYAVMNSSSLPCFVSLLLAEKCGIKHPELTAAIEQVYGFYTDYINQGTLPYGVHNPNAKSYNNNGMSGMAAVAFALKGDKQGAAFFSQMSLAASHNIETGHTGHYFNQLWTGLGARVAGPKASQAFFDQAGWLHTLNRKWSGDFTYDGCAYPQPIYGYRNLSDTGSHLLNLCIGRGKLLITGRDSDQSLWLDDKQVAETIALPTMDMKSKSDEQLLALFGHEMPKVRLEAIWTLRPRKHNLGDKVLAMTKAGTPLQRKSAIDYYAYGCPDEIANPAVETIVAIMRDKAEPVSRRAAAAGALAWRKQGAHPYYEDMLKLLAEEKPDDPRGIIDMHMGRAMTIVSADPYKDGLVKDKKLFYTAVIKLLDHKRADGRSAGTKLIEQIPLEDFHFIADKIAWIIDDSDKTYHSYHNRGPKTGSITIYANLKIKGGIEAAFAELESPLGKAGFKIRMLMAVIPKYGPAAKQWLPKIKATNAGKFQKQWDAMVKQIEAYGDEEVELISVEEAIRIGKRGVD
jgi:hypothetical protein